LKSKSGPRAARSPARCPTRARNRRGPAPRARPSTRTPPALNTARGPTTGQRPDARAAQHPAPRTARPQAKQLAAPSNHPARMTGGPACHLPPFPPGLPCFSPPTLPCRGDAIPPSPLTGRARNWRAPARSQPLRDPQTLAWDTRTPYTWLDAIPRRPPQPWPGMAIKANSRSPSAPRPTRRRAAAQFHAASTAGRGSSAEEKKGPRARVARAPEQEAAAAISILLPTAVVTALRTFGTASARHRLANHQPRHPR